MIGGAELKSLSLICFKGDGISCPYTPQNRSVERRNKHVVHVVETRLAIMPSAYVPMKYWDYGFQITIYRINKMPTMVLNNVNPYEALFPTHLL